MERAGVLVPLFISSLAVPFSLRPRHKESSGTEGFNTTTTASDWCRAGLNDLSARLFGRKSGRDLGASGSHSLLRVLPGTRT